MRLILMLLMLVGSVVVADASVVTFEGLPSGAPVGDYYNGGGGGNLGISFSSNGLALSSGNYGNNPSGTNILYFLTGSKATMNDYNGFSNGFSFYYASSSNTAGMVTVYDGLNGNGNVLAQFSLPNTPNPYYVWDPIGVSFSGTAHSVDFGGVANAIGFDDITIGSATAGQNAPVPEPGTIALLGIGMTGLAIYGRRRKNANA